jgi:hypothetical protein
LVNDLTAVGLIRLLGTKYIVRAAAVRQNQRANGGGRGKRRAGDFANPAAIGGPFRQQLGADRLPGQSNPLEIHL